MMSHLFYLVKTITFPNLGVFGFYCEKHVDFGMIGAITVSNSNPTSASASGTASASASGTASATGYTASPASTLRGLLWDLFDE